MSSRYLLPDRMSSVPEHNWGATSSDTEALGGEDLLPLDY